MCNQKNQRKKATNLTDFLKVWVCKSRDDQQKSFEKKAPTQTGNPRQRFMEHYGVVFTLLCAIKCVVSTPVGFAACLHCLGSRDISHLGVRRFASHCSAQLVTFAATGTAHQLYPITSPFDPCCCFIHIEFDPSCHNTFACLSCSCPSSSHLSLFGKW